MNKTNNRSLESRLSEIEEIISNISGSPPNPAIIGVYSLVSKSKLQAEEIKTLKSTISSHQKNQIPVSGKANLLKEIEDLKIKISTLEKETRSKEIQISSLQEDAIEAKDESTRRARKYVKGLLSDVFDDMNNSFESNTSYTGQEVSDMLYQLLRKHAFSVLEDINNNGMF